MENYTVEIVNKDGKNYLKVSTRPTEVFSMPHEMMVSLSKLDMDNDPEVREAAVMALLRCPEGVPGLPESIIEGGERVFYAKFSFGKVEDPEVKVIRVYEISPYTSKLAVWFSEDPDMVAVLSPSALFPFGMQAMESEYVQSAFISALLQAWPHLNKRPATEFMLESSAMVLDLGFGEQNG